MLVTRAFREKSCDRITTTYLSEGTRFIVTLEMLCGKVGKRYNTLEGLSVISLDYEEGPVIGLADRMCW